MKPYEKLAKLVEDRDESETIRSVYSGRGMMGRTCIGITTDDPMGVIESAIELGLRGALQDNMGRHMIVYWPKITTETP